MCQEADCVSDDKVLCKTSDLDHGVMAGIEQADDATKDHVDSRSEERRGDKQKHVLDDVGTQSRLVVMSRGTAYISYGLDCNRISLVFE